MSPERRNRVSGFEAIKRSASIKDAVAAQRLEHCLESLIGESPAIKSNFYQHVNMKKRDASRLNNLEKRIDDDRRFAQWVRRLKAENCSLDIVVQAVLGGESFSDLDRKMQRRNGWSRKQLIMALRIFRTME